MTLNNIAMTLDYGNLICLLQEYRGVQREMMFLDQTRVLMKYVLPLGEVVIDFYDRVKSESSGYARYECWG